MSFTQGCFVPSLVEICSVVLEKKIFKFRQGIFTLFRNYLPLAKGGALHLSKLEFPSLIDVLCQVLLILAQWLWRRKWKCEKFTIMTTTTTKTTTTDNWQILIRKTNLSLSLWLRWAKNQRKCHTTTYFFINCWYGLLDRILALDIWNTIRVRKPSSLWYFKNWGLFTTLDM